MARPIRPVRGSQEIPFARTPAGMFLDVTREDVRARKQPRLEVLGEGGGR